ncbi:MAG: helix-turn-helix domain-containing protein [Neptunomonas phycophila]|uniref:helix-turn-helix domain-containing protein n=1 Tax=Neptunomonas phycophila TaxID=1572645 RepID=UPI003B8E4246
MIYHPNAQIAPQKCIPLSIAEAMDADEHAHNLTDWQQEYDQIGSGSFYGKISELPLGNLQVFHEHTNQALHQKCNVWPDSIWLGLPVDSTSESRINGLALNHNDIMCRPGNCEFELMTPDNFGIFGMVVSYHALQTMADIQDTHIHWSHLTHHDRLCVPDKTLTALRFLLNRLLSQQTNEHQSRLQYDIVIMALLEILKKESPNDQVTPSYHRRKLVVDQVREYLAQLPDKAVTITELCEHTNVSRRTLQYSFESIIGISPVHYLRMSRLNSVRRALSLASSDQQSVANIASYWGFWHLSQFAKDYRELFGEKPSDTLLRSPLL